MRLKISSESLINCALFFLLLGGCFRWIYLGVGGGLLLQSFVLFLGLILILLAKKRIERTAIIWLLYPINIFSNIVLHNKLDSTTILYAFVVLEITLYVMFSDIRLHNYKKLLN